MELIATLSHVHEYQGTFLYIAPLEKVLKVFYYLFLEIFDLSIFSCSVSRLSKSLCSEFYKICSI